MAEKPAKQQKVKEPKSAGSRLGHKMQRKKSKDSNYEFSANAKTWEMFGIAKKFYPKKKKKWGSNNNLLEG